MDYIGNELNIEAKFWRVPSKKVGWRFFPVIRLDKNDELYSQFKDVVVRKKPIQIENKRIMLRKSENSVYLKDVTWSMNRQTHLAHVSLIAVLLSWIIWFFLSKLLVKKGLRDLHVLHSEISQQDIWNMNVIWNYDHLPENDEIAVLAKTFRENSSVLGQQINDMKQFISNASHELRTPLMSLRARQDLAAKNKKYDNLIKDNIGSIEHMQSLIDWLMLLWQQGQNQDIEEIFLTDIVNEIADEYGVVYKEKNVILHKKYNETKKQEISRFTITTILRNLIENAYKYVDKEGSIEINIQENVVHIFNSWWTLSSEEVEHIRKTFRQTDEARSQNSWHGLGLSIVKRLCDQAWYTISVESEQWKGTTFSLMLW